MFGGAYTNVISVVLVASRCATADFALREVRRPCCQGPSRGWGLRSGEGQPTPRAVVRCRVHGPVRGTVLSPGNPDPVGHQNGLTGRRPHRSGPPFQQHRLRPLLPARSVLMGFRPSSWRSSPTSAARPQPATRPSHTSKRPPPEARAAAAPLEPNVHRETDLGRHLRSVRRSAS